MVSEQRLEKAMHYLAMSDEKAAEMRAEVERTEYKAKVTKATVFSALEGTVADREAQAIKHDSVMEAYLLHFEAIKHYHIIANKRELERLVVEVWRSENANRRVGNV